MSTIQEFENAPVGATATSPRGSIAFKTARSEDEWSLYDSNGYYFYNLSSDEMGGFTLNPTAPTTAREAFDLTWNLAHEVKEGQVIPKGMRYVRRYQSGDLATFISNESWTSRDKDNVRTQDPLPDPEPDWLKAPAVKARVKDYSVLFTWVPVDGPRHHRWYSPVKGAGETYDWQDLCDVTPLYPKEDA